MWNQMGGETRNGYKVFRYVSRSDVHAREHERIKGCYNILQSSSVRICFDRSSIPCCTIYRGDTSLHLEPGHVTSGQEASVPPDWLSGSAARRHYTSRIGDGTFEDWIENSSVSSGICLAAFTAYVTWLKRA